MTITLDHIVPIPLKDRVSVRQSQIWNASFTIGSPDFIKIVAPSGTGKTTLMNIIYNLRQDYEGTLCWDGINIKTMSANEIAIMRQQKVSVVFQDLRLFANLTSFENIELNRLLQNPFYGEDKIFDMAKILGIENILHQKATLCSYGEQQRIAIIRALVQPFECLLMDEPFSHLDNENTRKAINLIAEECKKRNAGLIITGLDEDSFFDYRKEYKL